MKEVNKYFLKVEIDFEKAKSLSDDERMQLMRDACYLDYAKDYSIDKEEVSISAHERNLLLREVCYYSDYASYEKKDYFIINNKERYCLANGRHIQQLAKRLAEDANLKCNSATDIV